MPGFDCEFIEEPPRVFQTHCPICLLVLREPFQVTCCGKSFCRQCIQQINAGGTPCPTCKEARFDSFQNKGLQQPLYGFRVFCSNKESGCDWQGELGQLDQHLNIDPDKDKQFQGCAYTKVKCLYCNEPHPRHDIEHHRTSQCAERPFTCSLCEEYESTYTDVITNHSPVCKCRPVECPNSCGTNNLQHQHLEEHVSTQCPLSYVECEFSDAGCDAKVHRKDLPSHLGENMVTHMSLLARENRKLKQQLREQERKTQDQLKQQEEKIQEHCRQSKLQLIQQGESHKKLVQMQKDDTVSFLSRVPPIDLHPFLPIITHEARFSEPFYSHIGGYKLQLQIVRIPGKVSSVLYYTYKCRYYFLDSEFAVPPSATLHITTEIKLHSGNIRTTNNYKAIFGKKVNDYFEVYLKRSDRHITFHVSQIEIKT